MPASFSPSLAFGSGLAQGIENAEATKVNRQNKIDDDYRKMNMDLDFNEQLYSFKKKQDEQSAQNRLTQERSQYGLDANDSTGKMLQQSNVTTAQNPNNLPATPSGSTNTPQTQGNAAPIQAGQIQQSDLPPQQGQPNDMNPTGNPSLQTGAGGSWAASAATPAASVNPQSPQSIDPLKPPMANANTDPSQINQGTVFPNSDSDLHNTPYGMFTTAQLNEIMAIGAGTPEYKQGASALASGITTWKEKQAKILETTPNSIYANPLTFKQQADLKGLPYYMDPTTAGLSNKEFVQLRDKIDTRTEKESDPIIRADKESIVKLNNMIGLLGKVNTGGFNAVPGFGAIRSAVDSDFAQFRKDAAAFAIGNRPPGFGNRTSNLDVKVFQEASPNIANPNRANLAIANGFLRQKINDIEYWNFRSTMEHHYAMSDVGTVDRLWDNYLNANPVFAPNSTGSTPILNQNRQAWPEYFKGKSVSSILANSPQQAVQSSPQVPQSNAIPMNKDGKYDFSNF